MDVANLFFNLMRGDGDRLRQRGGKGARRFPGEQRPPLVREQERMRSTVRRRAPAATLARAPGLA